MRFESEDQISMAMQSGDVAAAAKGLFEKLLDDAEKQGIDEQITALRENPVDVTKIAVSAAKFDVVKGIRAQLDRMIEVGLEASEVLRATEEEGINEEED
tara:strand:- start:4498 stop:4797 length:300 start_codon:yes stop_codon:yes gene_type:complete